MRTDLSRIGAFYSLSFQERTSGIGGSWKDGGMGNVRGQGFMWVAKELEEGKIKSLDLLRQQTYMRILTLEKRYPKETAALL